MSDLAQTVNLEDLVFEAFESGSIERLAIAIRLLAHVVPSSPLLVSLTRRLFLERTGTLRRVLKRLRHTARDPGSIVSLAGLLIQVGEGVPPGDEGFRRYFGVAAHVALPGEDRLLLLEASERLRSAIGLARGDSANEMVAMLCQLGPRLGCDLEGVRAALSYVQVGSKDSYARAIYSYAIACERLGGPEAGRVFEAVLSADRSTFERGGHLSVAAHVHLGELDVAAGRAEQAYARLIEATRVKPCCHSRLRRNELRRLGRRLGTMIPGQMKDLVRRHPTCWRWDDGEDLDYLGA
jgi:hypothetical protein